MSNATRSGDMTAFQRWEMASFGDNRPAQVEEVKAANAQVAARQRLEAEHAREAAKQEGFAAGYKEAYERGLKDGQETAYAETMEQVQLEILALQQMAQAFSEQLHSASQQMGNELMHLAMDMAQAMLKAKLDSDPTVILPIVEEAIAQLASVQQPAQILLHPDDVAMVKNQLGEALSEDGWRIVSDTNMERGGCKLVTQHNLVDASYSTRWKKLLDSMQISDYKTD
ncbi:flagellar assembly protein H [Undibacterium sp. YM2]|uniref:flagellar assembly protein FliH n=1 Tax=Undibacterium sp. YM2 TaxID=2058625 RepID=UPI001331D750|nr:flagellar assembly protein FliH [Undibacterium sp. YM2]BBB66495.1 flagellar assembly protein H [Undibacterium sp. YM2]